MEQPESDSESSDTMPALCDESPFPGNAYIDKLRESSTEKLITSMMFKGTREYDCKDHMIVEEFVKSLSQILSVDHKKELINIILKSQKLDTTIVARKLIDYFDKVIRAKDFFDTETLYSPTAFW
jgi:hypothetical protein